MIRVSPLSSPPMIIALFTLLAMAILNNMTGGLIFSAALLIMIDNRWRDDEKQEAQEKLAQLKKTQDNA